MDVKAEQIFNEIFIRYPNLKSEKVNILASYQILSECYMKKGKVLVCGNGGSAADSGHITAELMKGFLLPRALKKEDLEKFSEEDQYIAKRLQYGLPAISLAAQSELVTALSNDNGAEMVFAQQVFAYGNKEDVLICISTSGNSKNVVNAAKVARSIGLKSITLTGKNGGKLKELTDMTICVPETVTYKIQEYHLPIYHLLCLMLEQKFFKI
ncbi:MAG: hypothetical protein H6Q70_1156 [Firmicutes bacterium]|nr:hypothetical protein [Bacillota bacterium]